MAERGSITGRGTRVIRLGTRPSALARVQASTVLAALKDFYTDLEIDLVTVSTSGDRSQASNQTGPDWGTGVFVKELESALLREEIDLAVHSLKDVPPMVTPGLTLAAIPVREDPLDVLITPDGRALEALEPGARVGTSSARRAAFLRAVRPDVHFLPIRGNVETRLRKLAEGQYEAIVLARAGLRRLEVDAAYVAIDPQVLPPAPGQGALAVQTRAGERRVLDLVEPLHDPATGAAVRAERRLMADLEGGCRLPVGALASPRGEGALHLLGGLARDDGSLSIAEATGRLDAPEQLADELAERLRTPGAGEQRRVLYA